MQMTIDNQEERELPIFSIPLSGIKLNNQKINYFDYISSLENKDCNEALKRIVAKINLDRINKIIDETPFIDELQRNFYKIMLAERKKRISDFSIEKLKNARK